MADRADSEAGRRDLQLPIEQREREYRDEDEDEGRDDGPGDLEHRVVGVLGRDRVLRFAEAVPHDEQEAEHEQGDDRDDRHQHHVVEKVHPLGQFGRRRLQADALIVRRAQNRGTFLGQSRHRRSGETHRGGRDRPNPRLCHLLQLPIPAAVQDPSGPSASQTTPLPTGSAAGQLR
jgi:hypothetical protein